MGMFDYVNFRCACPTCGADVGDFQSKDRMCEMATLEPDDCEHFYASCQKCRTWIEFYKPYTPVPHRPHRLNEEQVIALGFVKDHRIPEYAKQRQQTPYPIFCRQPEKCAGKSYCQNDPCCAD